jgi:hypothetical protein
MENNIENKTVTFDEALADPAFAHFHEAIHYIRKTPFSQMFPKKHELSLTRVVKDDVKKLFNKNPNMPIKLVITTVFEPLTNDIPAPLFLKLTQTIIEKWESLSTVVYEEKEAMSV